MAIALSLIALALGYQVYATALKEKEGLRLLGQVVGVFVMVAAIFAAICAIRCSLESCMSGPGAACPMPSMSSKAVCPVSQNQ